MISFPLSMENHAASPSRPAASPKAAAPVAIGVIARTWAPLAFSWLLMGIELPLLSAVVARMVDPEINLAAYGGVVFPIALVIEAPIIMLLVASTALSRDLLSYRRLRRFMMLSGALLTLLHVAIAFTPLYYVVARDLIAAPDDVLEPARIGLMIMTPWTWAIAYRRFNQGVLIRFGYASAVGIGGMVRMFTFSMVLFTGYVTGTIPGIVVATTGVALGVTVEAFYVKFRVRPVLRHEMPAAVSGRVELTWAAFASFYIPLALTPFCYLLVQPVAAAAISRMPEALASLAVWPALTGFLFMFKALGIAYNEVVVSLVERPHGYRMLRRFTCILAAAVTLVFIVFASSPLAEFWFGTLTGLHKDLAQMAAVSIWIAFLAPGLSVVESWFQGLLVHEGNTRAITESVALLLLTACTILLVGVHRAALPGIHMALIAVMAGSLAQTFWLWWRSRSIRKRLSGAGDRSGHSADHP